MKLLFHTKIRGQRQKLIPSSSTTTHRKNSSYRFLGIWKFSSNYFYVSKESPIRKILVSKIIESLSLLPVCSVDPLSRPNLLWSPPTVCLPAATLLEIVAPFASREPLVLLGRVLLELVHGLLLVVVVSVLVEVPRRVRVVVAAVHAE